MKSRILFLMVIIPLLFCGCGKDNPKTKNELLRDKKISWDNDNADYHEFLADGTLIAVGGDWPEEGYKGQQWESVDENGSFKIIPDPATPDTYTIARLKTKMGPGAQFTFEYFVNGTSEEKKGPLYTVDGYDDINKSHKSVAASLDAQAHVIQYANQVYKFDVFVDDPKGIVKRVRSSGKHITTQVIMTTATRWNLEPVVDLSEGTRPQLPIETHVEIVYHDGHTEAVNFKTKTIKDFSSQEFEDPWF